MDTDAITPEKIERIADGGNLLENLLLIVPQSWQTSQEVFADWQAGAPVQGVNTANLAVYRLVDGKPVFDLLAREGNLFLDDKFRKEVYNGISSQEFFIPSGDMLEHLMSAITGGKAVEVPYSGLNLKTENCIENYGFVESDANNKPDEKKLISGVYGAENPGNGKKIYLLRPDKIKTVLGHNVDSAVVRACYFNDHQGFYAIDGDILNANSAVRGVRRVNVAEDDAQKNVDYFVEQIGGPAALSYIVASLVGGKAFKYKERLYAPIGANNVDLKE